MYIETPRMVIRDFTPEDAADLPAPVATMLEKKHGCFDAEPYDIHVISGETDSDAVLEQLKKQQKK